MGKKNKNRERKSSGISLADLRNHLDELGELGAATQELAEEADAIELAKAQEAERLRAYADVALMDCGDGHFKFVNPYTFFPLENVEPERKARGRFYTNGVTGTLHCSLKVQTRSPLFVPNTTGRYLQNLGNGREHRLMEFHSNEDLSESSIGMSTLPAEGPAHPAIPGSSIRGMVRSVYEQLTNSCLSQIDETNIPSKRSPVPKTPYRMEYNDNRESWELFETEVYKLGRSKNPRAFSYNGKSGRQAERLFDGRNSYRTFTIPANSRIYASQIYDKTGHGTRVFLHSTGDMRGKHLTLFPVDRNPGAQPIASFPENSTQFERFMRVVDGYCAALTQKNHNDASKGYKVYRDRIKNHETVLVYADEGFEHLSPASIGQESMNTTISAMADRQHRHAACSGKRNGEAGPEFCPACRLFGAIGEEAAIGSRIRFTEARWTGGKPAYRVETLPALSSPKASATEFYLRRPSDNAEYWNYDHSIRWHGRGRASTTPYDEGTYAGLQGRKVYWHFPYRPKAQYDESLLGPSNQNVTVRLLESGAFEFEVHFEDISKTELANLVFAIGGTGEGRLQKLGHGKPLGLGSVLVKVESCTLDEYGFDGAAGVCTHLRREASAEEMASWLPSGERDKARRELVEFFAADLATMSVPHDIIASEPTFASLVSYPKPKHGKIGAPDGKSNMTFEWFKKNMGSIQSPKYKQTLNTRSVEEVLESKQSSE